MRVLLLLPMHLNKSAVCRRSQLTGPINAALSIRLVPRHCAEPEAKLLGACCGCLLLDPSVPACQLMECPSESTICANCRVAQQLVSVLRLEFPQGVP